MMSEEKLKKFVMSRTVVATVPAEQHFGDEMIDGKLVRNVNHRAAYDQ